MEAVEVFEAIKEDRVHNDLKKHKNPVLSFVAISYLQRSPCRFTTIAN